MAAWTFKEVPDLTGFRVLWSIARGWKTGTTEHSNAAKIILVCRSEEPTRAAMADIAATTPFFPGAAPTADRLELLILDLSDLPQVRQAADELKKRFDRIDIICINNAGMNAMGTTTTTAAGHEIEMSVNHFGHFVFNAGEMPLLLASKAVTKKPARICSIVS
ncbi:hypothetical protein T484DRAFT_1883458, partial [Baffinella frigidus]